MMRLRLAIAVITLLAGASSAAQAQTIPSPYRYIETAHAVTLFSGYLATDRGDEGFWPASGPLIGAQYTGRFAAPVAGVVRLWAAPSERAIFSRENASDPESEIIQIDDASAVIIGGKVGLRLLLTGPRTWHSLAPFLEATGGMMSVAGSRTERERELPAGQIIDYGPSFALGVGAGTDWFLTDRISLNLAGRATFWRLTTPEGLGPDGRETTSWTPNLGVAIGAAYHF